MTNGRQFVVFLVLFLGIWSYFEYMYDLSLALGLYGLYLCGITYVEGEVDKALEARGKGKGKGNRQ